MKSAHFGIWILALAALALPAPLAAQNDGAKKKYGDTKTVRRKALSSEFGRHFRSWQDLVEAEDWQGCLKLLERVGFDDWRSHERAELHNRYGMVYASTGDYDKALEHYIKLLDEPDAPSSTRNTTFQYIGQLYLVQGDPAKALEFLHLWLDSLKEISASAYGLLATAYYMAEDYDKALEYVETAIGMMEKRRDGKGRENWYSLQFSIYHQRDNHDEAMNVLVNKLLSYFPRPRYWRALSGMYGQMEDGKRQHAALDLVYLQDELKQESGLRNLASLFAQERAYWQCAQIMRKGLDDGIMERTAKNLRILGECYYAAREVELALPVMEEAAELSDDGKIYESLAHVYSSLQQHEDCLRVAAIAMERGELKRPDQLRLAMGMAHFNMERYEEAISTFRDIKDERSQKAAVRWQNYVASQRDRDQQMRDSGVDLDEIRRGLADLRRGV